MPRTKSLNIVVQFTGTPYIINDAFPKEPRYELYDTVEKKIIRKSNNPLEFDDYMENVWKEQ